MNVLIYCRQIQAVNNPIAVSYRNAGLLAKELNADILMSKTDRLQDKDYDIIICTYSNRYTDFTTLESLCKKTGQKRFLLRTEYEKVGSLITSFKPFAQICNFEGGDNFLNTNLLIAKQPNKLTDKKYGCIYYSRYRADRMEYCREYLQGEVYLSTHPKNHKHFYHAGCRPKLIKHIDWTPGRETLNQFRYSFYMEDKYTHSVFNNLANRWYEAGFCNNVVFFDHNCINTIIKSSLGNYIDEVHDYIVTDYDSLQQKIKECDKDFMKHLNTQKGWRVNELKERAGMINDLKGIIGITS
jgi:hypothetical protein